MISEIRRPKILSLWDTSFSPHVLDALFEHANLVIASPTRENLESLLPDCEIYLASLAVRLDAELICAAPRLRLVATPSTGLDHLDLAALVDRGVELISLKTEYDLLDRVTATAELAWALLLASVRKIPAAAAAANRGEWARDRFRGNQLAYKTLGILGVGRLGSMVAEYGKAFRMRVLGCDRHPRRIVPGVEYVDFHRLLRESDVLSIHIHATPDNVKLFDAAAFAEMKNGMVIVNTSRGSVIDEEELLKALRSGKVAAAGLDVVDGEWRSDLIDHPLIERARTHDNVIILPHLGGVTVESQRMAHEFIVTKVNDWLTPAKPISDRARFAYGLGRP